MGYVRAVKQLPRQVKPEMVMWYDDNRKVLLEGVTGVLSDLSEEGSD
ncbi:hypothetical protein AM1_6203 [Acaryochloris marina MBIC11017]|uniref:Uncharacterized protein n=1 Tax=Acaryochloris marina (strain MBIC 11017) TaxID=329726 RepID=B0C618_ACAM1|nr:hypothetical protein AM1_6203 [Acaryochloris marina MBIC11017]